MAAQLVDVGEGQPRLPSAFLPVGHHGDPLALADRLCTEPQSGRWLVCLFLKRKQPSQLKPYNCWVIAWFNSHDFVTGACNH